ncbi:cytochrome P450 71A9-like [Hibiscus syriacus]|uniref:Cytochrome P450 71A9-like n=1 Tax=Hibiscus syriacus TaxID=106335 RepID=A0A6A2XN76_HIBSY|nr:cytochrome P450 71A9-like [Hibiscus syriacus]
MILDMDSDMIYDMDSDMILDLDFDLLLDLISDMILDLNYVLIFDISVYERNMFYWGYCWRKILGGSSALCSGPYLQTPRLCAQGLTVRDGVVWFWGTYIFYDAALKAKAVRFFRELYVDPHPDSEPFLPIGQFSAISEVDRIALKAIPDDDEIKAALFHMEIVHSMRNKKTKQGWMAIKIDLEKAFDKVKWSFIHATLLDFDFISGTPFSVPLYSHHGKACPPNTKPCLLCETQWLDCLYSFSSWESNSFQICSSGHFDLFHANNKATSEDRCVWNGDFMHKFRVRDAYCKLVEDSLNAPCSKPPSDDASEDRCDWNGDFMHKFRVPGTRYGPYPFHNVFDPVCSLCGLHDETTLYIFRDCQAVKSIWNQLLLGGLENSFFTSSLFDCIRANLAWHEKLLDTSFPHGTTQALTSNTSSMAASSRLVVLRVGSQKWGCKGIQIGGKMFGGLLVEELVDIAGKRSAAVRRRKHNWLNSVINFSWNATVTAVSSSSGNNKLKFDDVRDLVLSKEIRRRESGEASTSSTLHTESRGRTSERNSNHGRSKYRRGKSRTGKKDFTCYNCGKKGHFKRDCRALKKNTSAQESANVTEETGDAMILSVNSPIESWILDSGASFHFTPCQEIMENYVSGDFGKVHLADDETLKILDGEGYSTTFSGCEWKITKGELVIAHGKKTGTLYVTSNLENIIVVANADGKSNLWHQRLGHMSEKGMKILLSKGKLPNLKNVDAGLCEDCIFGKQKKVSFAKIGKAPKAERKVWVYFLKKKSEVFDTFRKLKAMVENETGLKVKRLRSDNGGEYRDSRFRDFYANNGIKMETTVPITPQQNGIAERMNKTLNERARSMRIHAGLPKFLWAEAINTAAYLINCGPSVPLDDGIPEEAWSKKEINLSHLRVFGCISYVHIDSAERSKLDAKSNKCAFGLWRSTAESSNTEAETKEFAEFEEISGNDVQINVEAVQEEPRTPELRRSSRIPKPTQRYLPSLYYLLLTDNGEPECYDEAMQVEDSVKWESSMKDEIDSLMSNQTWELAELPPGKKALHNKWIYRIKEEHDGIKRYKARLVVKGFQQKEAAENLHLEQLDIKTTFLHGDLEEEIYMRQPEGFIEADKKNLVCRLKKSLYGLKQAPRQWYKKFDSFMSSSGFTRCQADHCCYIKRFDNSFIIFLLYVHDILVQGSDMQEIINLKQKLSKQFVIKDLGAAKQILGMRIKRDINSGTLMLSQPEYINKVLFRFNMQDAKPVPYASAIGSLMYAMVCTRPDIAQAVGAVSRYMNNPGKVHWKAVKWILRYLRGTTNKALCFKGGDTILTGYVDDDLAGNVDIRRSTTGYVYTLGGTAVSCVSQLQKIVALSTTEAEYVAVTEASKEMVWLQSFLEELGKKQENNVLYCDSQINTISGSSLVGGIGHLNDGTWLFGFHKAVSVTHPLQAKLWGMHLGLLEAWNHGVELLQVQSDNLQAINLLNNIDVAGDTMPLVRAISQMCYRNWFVEFIWTPREGNTVADSMAKLNLPID